MSEQALASLKNRFGSAILETHSHLGDDTALVTPDTWLAVADFCRNDASMAFNMLTDLCGVDYPNETPRIEVVMHLYSTTLGHRLRLKTRVGEQDLGFTETVNLASVTKLWRAANWLEREVYDLTGINFVGHPDMRRILMYPEFQGHPLRKDYPAEKTQPLIEFRTEAEAGLTLNKVAPFGADEGMAFGRHQTVTRDEHNN
jgi:NADH-quinone oxidoreductase subunit C